MKQLSILCLCLFVFAACAGGQSRPANQPAQSCTPKSFNGSGDSVIDTGNLDGCTKATLKHSGSENFIIAPYDATNKRMLGLANEIGNYQGVAKWRAGTRSLEIKADGQWSISVN